MLQGNKKLAVMNKLHFSNTIFQHILGTLNNSAPLFYLVYAYIQCTCSFVSEVWSL